MDKDYFIKLVFGTHKVADLLGGDKEIKIASNSLLVDLLLFCEENPVTIEQKRNILPRTLRKIDALQTSLLGAKNKEKADPKYFLILQREYSKIPSLLIAFLESQKLSVKQEEKQEEHPLSLRQKKILGMLEHKERTQVWELQKILPEVTKRTLRRDLDDLLKLNLIERQGEWNGVFYRIKS